MIRKLLCKLGLHKFVDYSRQVFCLNNPSSAPLEFNTRIYSRCVCGRKASRWRRDRCLNNDRRVSPWGEPEPIPNQFSNSNKVKG